MHFSLFIPGAAGASPKVLESVGLGHLLRDGDASPLLQELQDKGPDGGPGLLVVWPPEMPAYIPGQLTWQPAKPDPDRQLPAKRFWWGYNPASPPTADDLQRTTVMRGHLLDVADDYWLMPNIMLLPHSFILDDNGNEARQVNDDHKAIYDRGLWAFDLLKQQIEGIAAAPGKEMRQYVIEMLSLNFRIFRDLAYHIGLLTDANWFSFACNTVDIHTLIEIEQAVAKKKRDTLTAAAIPPTSPPGAGATA